MELQYNKVDSIEILKTLNLKNGNVVEVLGCLNSYDGAQHYRVITTIKDTTSIALNNGLFANLIKPIKIFDYVNFDELKKSSLFIGAKAKVHGLVFDICEKLPEEVGFEDELHIKILNNVYAIFNIDESDFSYIKTKQNENISKYINLMANDLSINIVLQGDSITYGHDTVSSDKISPPETVLPDGSKHTVTRSPNPISKKLQEYLQEITSNQKINVINRGYSGDWAQKSYSRWRTSANSNLTLFLLGQNDQGASWVPDKYKSYKEFFKWNLMLGIREILRGAAVVFTNGYKVRSSDDTKNRQSFLEMTKNIAETINGLFLDTNIMLYGTDYTFYSDGVHLNSKGNSKMASRMAGFFVGENLIKPVIIKENGHIGVTYDFFNIYKHRIIQENIPGSNGVNGEMYAIYKGETIYIPFYLDCEESEFLILSGDIIYKEVEVTIDFDNPQAIQKTDFTIYQNRQQPPSKLNSNLNNYIKITGKGYHVIKIYNDINSESMYYLNGIDFRPIDKSYIGVIENSNLTGNFFTDEAFIIDFIPKFLSDIREIFLYNQGRVHGYLGHYYFETYQYSYHGLSTVEINKRISIKFYSTIFDSIEIYFTYILKPDGKIEFDYKQTGFNKPTIPPKM